MAIYAKISQPFPAMNIHRTIFHHGCCEEIQHQPDDTTSPEYPTASSILSTVAIVEGIPQAVMWNKCMIRVSDSIEIFLQIVR